MPRSIPSFAVPILAAALLGLVAAPLSAQDSGYDQGQDRGYYIEGMAGVSLPQDSEVSAGGASADVSLDAGFTGGLALGYTYGNGFRAELEFGIHDNDIDRAPGLAINGDIQTFSLMLNALYDFNYSGPITPFLGVGIGGARVKVNADAHPNVTGTVDDSDSGFAWQAMAGVAYEINDRMRASLRYRYFSVPDINLTSSGGTSFETDYASHDIMFGLRWSFGARKARPKAAPAAAIAPPPPASPPPPPPPAPRATPKPPPPPITRNFIVFFDFDQAALTSRARGIIRAAAVEARKRPGVRLALTGHADRAGRTGYNQRLSMRRADTVRRELVRLGIARNEIRVSAKGESAPLVSTADGVREAQNRRVEIVLN